MEGKENKIVKEDDNTEKKAEKVTLTRAELAEKKRNRKETEKFKKKYFEYYDDVKISHREDW